MAKEYGKLVVINMRKLRYRNKYHKLSPIVSDLWPSGLILTLEF